MKAVLLVGSPKMEGSTSRTLGDHLMRLLSNKGISTCVHDISTAIHEGRSYDTMMEDVRSSDMLVLSYPLYMDSLPSDVIRWMELVRDLELDGSRKLSLMAIGNCESPDPNELKVSLAIVRNFCSTVGIRYLGGLGFPMGHSIEGKALEETGGRGRSAIEALELAADAVANDEDVPKKAVELMAEHPMTEMFYLMAENKRWKAKAKAKGTRLDIYDKPLLK